MAGAHAGPRPCVLLAAGRAAWEPEALRVLAAAGIVVLRRCVDLPDLLAVASSGRADVAVVAGDVAGLDADAVHRLRTYDVRTIAIVAGAAPDLLDRLSRLGVTSVVDTARLADAVEGVLASTAAEETSLPHAEVPGRAGRIVAVWGPAGAPGRTTLAVGLAAEHAFAGEPVVLLDADPYGGAVAQHLGILDEVSGLLACARLVNEAALAPESFARCRRTVADRLDVVTGLPRPDRWIEVRPGVIEEALDQAACHADVVVDCGFSIEDTDGAAVGRNTMTLEALACADEVVIVGSTEPTGLARLARALVELGELVPATPSRVVVNRMRDSLGWRSRDIVGMIEGYAGGVRVHFLPEDRAGVDRALVAGRSLVETGDSPLRAAIAQVHRAVWARVDV